MHTDHFLNANPNITMVFLTPHPKTGGADKLEEEYHALDDSVLGGHNKKWLYWCCPEDVKFKSKAKIFTIEDMIIDTLTTESIGMISPIADYERHTLKAFRQSFA